MNENHDYISNTHEVGTGRITVTSNDYGTGTYTTMCDHGATTSGATYIGVFADGNAHVHWNGTYYSYKGGNALDIVSFFASTMSMGKTANLIKRTSTLDYSAPLEDVA